MGKVFSFTDKLVGIDRKGLKKSALEQSQAIKDASDATSRDAAFAAQANQQQIETTAAQNTARQQAQDLLGKPMETATVDLGPSDDDEDMLGRKKGGVRNTYQSGGGAQAGLVV